MATHTATRRTHGHRQATLPRHPRRISGPVARPVPRVPHATPVRRGTTGAFERLRALPDHRMVDRLLRGRVWVWVIGIMLGGIVAMQVSLLKLNAGISRAVTTAGTLERANADLETEVARLSSGERIQRIAADEKMVAPPAGDVGFLTARPGTDPALAVDRMQSPSDEARQVMDSGGRAPAVPAVPAPGGTVTPVVPDPAAAAPVTTPAPAATVAPAPTATPVPTATPDPLPPAATDTGATTAPTG